MNVTAEFLAEALEGLPVEFLSGGSIRCAEMLSPGAVAAEALRRVAERHPEPASLLPGEAARMLGLSVAGLSRRARDGQVPHTFTPGGHRRYAAAVIRALARGPGGSR